MSDEIKVRWGDLGSPTTACEMDYYGTRVIVTATDIEAAKGNPVRRSIGFVLCSLARCWAGSRTVIMSRSEPISCRIDRGPQLLGHAGDNLLEVLSRTVLGAESSTSPERWY